MKEIKIAIAGCSPLLCNRFTDKAQGDATAGTGSAIVGDRGTPRELAEQALYLDHAGRPCIPQPNLYRCLLDAGKYFKAGKSKVTTQKTSLIPSCLDIDGVAFPILHEEPWDVDTRPVRIPATGGRILKHRPSFNDWRLEFTARLDETVMGEKLLREIVDKAGSAIGLGDFRPDCKGPFGKFKVVLWEAVALEAVE